MATVPFPSWFRPDSFSMWMVANQRVFSSPFGGSEQAVDMLNERWMASVTAPPRINTEGGAIEALISSFRGMTNTVDLWHMQRPVPRGTMRGTPACAAAAQGADALTLSAAGAGATLLAGDMIGIAGLLLQVQEDATANGAGVMAVKIANRLRKAVAGSSLVTWNKPTAPFRLISTPAIRYLPGYAEGVTLDFAEVIL